MAENNWIILTGEYPPQRGGVADYTRLVAGALATRGDRVTVVAPAAAQPDQPLAGVAVHRTLGHFDRPARREIERLIQRMIETQTPTPTPRPRLLVQYVPHAYGQRAMNVGFARWVRRLARSGLSLDVMFHEVAYPLERGQPMKHRILAIVNRRMARWIAESAARVFVTIPAWETMLRKLGVRSPIHWLPIPANIPATADPAEVERVRQRLRAPHPSSGSAIIGHFGTYHAMIADRVAAIVPQLLQRRPEQVLLLLGYGSEKFAAQLRDTHPALAARIFATGPMEPPDLASHLAACTLMVQPYPDGISCRRGSAMAALALGVPIVTALGHLSEPLWKNTKAVLLADTNDTDSFVATAESALADSPRVRAVGGRGRCLYQEQFTLDATINSLRA